MPIKSILFAGAVVIACLGSLAMPLIGVLGYMGIYLVDPTAQWWGASLRFQRFSLLSASFLAAAVALHWPRLSRTRPRLGAFEVLCFLFLGIMWLSLETGLPPSESGWMLIDKMTKLFAFLLMFRWVVTTPTAIRAVLWCLLLGGLYVAWQAFTAPPSFFRQGRLAGLGASDFAGANDFGIHLAATLPIAAALIIQYRRLWQRGLVVVTVVLAMNTIVQTRSRSAFLALAVGFVIALIYSPRRYRLPLVGLAIVGSIGFYALTDPGFWQRIDTIKEGERDASTSGRVVVWRASVPMFRDYPLGVGIGNFQRAVARYVEDESAVRDTHNTFITCYTELGVQGAAVFGLILFLVWRSLSRAARLARDMEADDMQLYAFALRVSLAAYLVGGITIKRLYAECFWWFVILPPALLHVVTRMHREHERLQAEAEALEPPPAPDLPAFPARFRL